MSGLDWMLERATTSLIIRIEIRRGLLAGSPFNSMDASVLCGLAKEHNREFAVFHYSSRDDRRLLSELRCSTEESEHLAMARLLEEQTFAWRDNKDVVCLCRNPAPTSSSLILPPNHYLVTQNCAFLQGVLDEYFQDVENDVERELLQTMIRRLSALIRIRSDEMMWLFQVPTVE